MSDKENSKPGTLLRTISPLLAVAVFFWGIYTYHDTSTRQLEEQVASEKRTSETRRIEATLPYLRKQLELYIEATQVTATLATSDDSQAIDEATKRFNELYWGELALVEHAAVEKAMNIFRNALIADEAQEELQFLALDLARACREELAVSWGTDAWKR